MRKRYIASAVGTISASVVVGYMLRNKENRKKLKSKIDSIIKNAVNNNYEQYTTIEAAGIPDQIQKQDLAQLENTKMLSEGSQYGVNYYNQVKEEDTDNVL